MKLLIQSLRMLVVLTIVTGLIYPLIIYCVALVAFPSQSQGSLIYNGGKAIGSELIGQNFTADKYFHPRPSACGYDASNSAGSNLAPTSPQLLDNVQKAVEQYRIDNKLQTNAVVPADAVTTSGSGLDPDISPANAKLQAVRVAKARGVDSGRVLKLVDKFTSLATLGVLGENRDNVLLINLALDRGAY